MNRPSSSSIGDETAVAPGRRLRLGIERVVFQGDGLGRLPDGRVAFVPYTAPGDEVEVEVVGVRGDFIRAELVRVLTPSPARTDPPCRYFGRCGGCQWQHMEYGAQLSWKREMLQELLVRVGKLPGVPVLPPIPLGEPWRYRGRAQFKVAAGERPAIGFHQRETNRVVDVEACPLLHPQLEGVLRVLRGMRHPTLAGLFPGARDVWASVGSGTGETLVSLFARARDRGAIRLLFHAIREEVSGLQGLVLLDGDPRHQPRCIDRHGSGALHEQVGEHRFRVDATAFFQVSGLAAEALTAQVLEAAELTGAERVLDLYCGVGTFTVPLARSAREVVGIEAVAPAAADAVHNLSLNGCPAGRVVHGQVEQILPGMARSGAWDVVLLDPPRQGSSRRVLETIAGMAVRRLIYVSCDPSTLSRDLAVLAGVGFRCLRLQPIDLFPHTFHLESVALLERPAPA